MNDTVDRSSPSIEQFSSMHFEMSKRPEQKSILRIESGSDKGKEITHTRDDFTKDESQSPNKSHDSDPDSPAESGVAVCVSTLSHDSSEDVFSRNVSEAERKRQRDATYIRSITML